MNSRVTMSFLNSVLNKTILLNICFYILWEAETGPTAVINHSCDSEQQFSIWLLMVSVKNYHEWQSDRVLSKELGEGLVLQKFLWRWLSHHTSIFFFISCFTRFSLEKYHELDWSNKIKILLKLWKSEENEILNHKKKF